MTRREAVFHHLYTAPAGPGALRPEIPPELDALVLELLAKDPAARPPDAGHVAAALKALSQVGGRGTDHSATRPQAAGRPQHPPTETVGSGPAAAPGANATEMPAWRAVGIDLGT